MLLVQDPPAGCTEIALNPLAVAKLGAGQVLFAEMPMGAVVRTEPA